MTPAEKRSIKSALEVVERWDLEFDGGTTRIAANRLAQLVRKLCDLHARKPDGGNGNE